MTLLAVSIPCTDAEHIEGQAAAAAACGAEAVELRTDYMEGLTAEVVPSILGRVREAAGPGLRVIVTCRSGAEGGVRKYSDRTRIDVLAAALKAGAEFVDLEYESYRNVAHQERIRVALSRSRKGRLILSSHSFEGRFADIKGLYRDISTVCPEAIPKLVYKAGHINDCFEALDLLHKSSGERIVLCMGEAGVITRILAKKLGSYVTFASVDEGSATAAGQLTIESLKGLYRYDSIDSATSLYGVIADPVGHSMSPSIHNACFGESGLNSLYLPLLVGGGYTEFHVFMNAVSLRRWLDFRGFSITIPHKHHALHYVGAEDGFVEPLARKIGAVNTLLLSKDGRVKAYNTDYAGALDAITEAMAIGRDELKDLDVAVLGAGGVARAIVAGLSDAGAQITIYNRTLRKAETLAAEFGCEFAGPGELAETEADLLVNCTSVGMHPNVDETPVPDTCLKKGMTVFDTVYNPVETLLLRQAVHSGAKTIDGVSMFVNQAMAQFRLFTGQEADRGLMRRTVCEGQS